MNKTTSDPGTPIFGQLNEELGELPEITIHDFDWHGFDFPTDVEQAESTTAKAEKPTAATSTASKPTTAKNRSASKSAGESSADTAAPKTRTTKSGTSTGGRRRKEP